MKFAALAYDITHLTLAMLLHYFGKLEIQISCICRRKCKQIASNYVIHPQILIFSVFKIARVFPHTECK